MPNMNNEPNRLPKMEAERQGKNESDFFRSIKASHWASKHFIFNIS